MSQTQDSERFRQTLLSACGSLGVDLPGAACNLMIRHYLALVEANRSVNLTRITAPGEAAIKHYADSLALSAWLRVSGLRGLTMLDIGTGAGFPAVPVAAVHPDCQVTAIDGTGKKIRFLHAFVEESRLTNLLPLHARAEHWQDHARFDVVVTRAVGPAARCLGWAAPWVAEGGSIVLYKLATLKAGETSEMQHTATQLGLIEQPAYAYGLNLDGDSMQRALRVFSRT